MRPIQATCKISHRGAGDQVTVGVMTVRQLGDAWLQTSAFQPVCQRGRRLLAGIVGIAIEDKIDLAAAAVAELGKLGRCQVRPESAGSVAEPCLPEYGEIEESFDENDGRKLAHRLPGEQASLGARQKSMGKSRANTASIEIDHAALLRTGEDDAPAKRVATLWIDQPGLQQ